MGMRENCWPHCHLCPLPTLPGDIYPSKMTHLEPAFLRLQTLQKVPPFVLPGSLELPRPRRAEVLCMPRPQRRASLLAEGRGVLWSQAELGRGLIIKWGLSRTTGTWVWSSHQGGVGGEKSGWRGRTGSKRGCLSLHLGC